MKPTVVGAVAGVLLVVGVAWAAVGRTPATDGFGPSASTQRQITLGQITQGQMSRSGAAVASSRVARDAPEAQLSKRTQASLTRHGISFSAVRPGAQPVSEKSAAATAEGAYGFTAGHSPAVVVLGRLTDANYGRETSSNPVLDSHVQPSIKDRLVWLVVFRDVDQPYLGPPCDCPPTQKADMWVAVDAQTGNVLEGASIP